MFSDWQANKVVCSEGLQRRFAFANSTALVQARQRPSTADCLIPIQLAAMEAFNGGLQQKEKRKIMSGGLQRRLPLAN